jgi:DNA (cytosine-5)-methyltransferase 1
VNESPNIPNFLSVADAAVILKVSSQAVRTLLRNGQLGGQKIGNSWMIHPDEVNKVAVNRGVLGTPSKQAFTGSKKAPRMRALSFFSGAMGLDLGMERAGIETVLACEFDKWSRRTIEVNRPDLPLLGDIWNYDASQIREIAGFAFDEDIDLVVGGPPCQAFSTAGARRGFEDERGNVFLHYIDVALALNPKFIVIENVRGLLSAPMKHRPHAHRGTGFTELSNDESPGGALAYVIHLLREGGYSVSFNLYNSANFGTPQTRERVILVCSRDGKTVQHLSPTHSDNPERNLKPWRTFRDVVADLSSVEQHHLEFPEDRLRYYRLLGPGQYWKHLPVDLQREALGNSFFSGGGKTGFFRRLAWDKPSPTLVTHPTMPATDLAHPEEDRPLSIEEYKRVQEFPDSWKLQGPLVQQYKQVGNAVPASLGEALGRTLIAHLDGRILPIPEGFRFSRYHNTDEDSWTNSLKTSKRKKASRPNDLTLF